jgi:FKBP-type peptidyl-prolyl cis-trans isomerase FklB
MKKITIAGAFLALVGFVCQNAVAAGPTEPTSLSKYASYAVGVELGKNLAPLRVVLDYDEFLKGFKDVLAGKKPRVADKDAERILNMEFSAALKKVSDANLVEANRFMRENGKKPGVMTTKSGLQYQVLKAGVGPKPDPNSMVRVSYIGKLTNGTEFDRSRPNSPAEFELSKVIHGWSEGVGLMNKGAKYRLFIPPALAYGEQSPTPAIPPNSVLVFDVELVDIMPPPVSR